MIIRSALFASVLVATPVTATPMFGAQDLLPNAPYVSWPDNETIIQINLQHSAELEALRVDGLAIQRADGGTLTPAHRAELQARLDKIQASYRRLIYRSDPWAVDSMGMRKY